MSKARFLVPNTAPSTVYLADGAKIALDGSRIITVSAAQIPDCLAAGWLLIDTTPSARPYFHQFFDDFDGASLASSDWSALDTGAATETLGADVANGVLTLALTNANEVQLAGASKGDQRVIRLARGPIFEARFRFTVLPTTGVIAAIGLAADHNADLDAIQESIWFRADANGALTVESDDNDAGHETSKIATGRTLVANQWVTARIDLTNPKSAKFFLDEIAVATSTTFDFSKTAGLMLQQYARVSKGASTEVGTMEVDYIHVISARNDL